MRYKDTGVIPDNKVQLTTNGSHPTRHQKASMSIPVGRNNPQAKEVAEQLVDAEGLLASLFAPDSRPTVRWLRNMQDQRKIPYYKIGRLVRFSPSEVKAALDQKCRVASA